MNYWPPKFCAACGARLAAIREHGHRRWGCRRCGFTNYGNPVATVVGIMMRGSRVLLTRRARPPWANTWDLPGGFLEAGETADDGIAREFVEELGVGIRRARLLGLTIDRYGRRGFPLITAVYRVTPEPGPIRVADDVAEARWLERTAIPFRKVALPSMREVLRRWVVRNYT